MVTVRPPERPPKASSIRCESRHRARDAAWRDRCQRPSTISCMLLNSDRVRCRLEESLAARSLPSSRFIYRLTGPNTTLTMQLSNLLHTWTVVAALEKVSAP